ncbi:MAG: DUF5684 domain-containing protein [Ignavibacteriae bacterium]|jgi:hypothetical protein|nr:DUF5684 domain-containing protein [Ignavibacteriota bacterium]
MFFALSLIFMFYKDDDMQSLGGGASILMVIIYLIVGLLIVISLWKLFVKAGKPGWPAIIPIYNTIVYLEIIGRPIWWIILLLIPCVSFVVYIMICIDFAKSFGKETGYGIGLFILPFIFFPMLAFGDAQYVGPAAKK